MSFYNQLKVIETALGTDGKYKTKEIKYPSYQRVTILTVHIRRELIPRQLNMRSGKEMLTKIQEKGKFNSTFTKKLLQEFSRASGACNHCITGAWAYIRVGAETHLLWMKGQDKDIGYVKGGLLK